jgi:hypothetical protein
MVCHPLRHFPNFLDASRPLKEKAQQLAALLNHRIRFYFGLAESGDVPLFPFELPQSVAIISTLVTLNVWSPDEPLEGLAADEDEPELGLAAFEALLDCCDP